MKEIIILLLLAVILTGCSGKKTIESNVDSSSSVQTLKEETAMQSNGTVASEIETTSQGTVIAEAETSQKASNGESPDSNKLGIKEGIGIGDIAIGKSTLSDVIKEFGDNYKTTTWDDGYSDVKYESLGILFYCDNDESQTIYKIILTAPYVGETIEGISIGESTMSDVFQKYGESPEWLTDKDSDTWWCEYSGINFHVLKQPEFSDNDEKELDKKISKIEVVEMGRD